jgi:hypothetical protein
MTKREAGAERTELVVEHRRVKGYEDRSMVFADVEIFSSGWSQP